MKASFPDVELALVTLLASFVPSLEHVDVRTPTDLQDFLPFIRVDRYSGSDDTVSDRSEVAVDVMSQARPEGIALAERVRQFLTGGPHRVVLPGCVVVIDRVRTITAPVEPPVATSVRSLPVDTTLRRFYAAYSVSARRVWA